MTGERIDDIVAVLKRTASQPHTRREVRCISRPLEEMPSEDQLMVLIQKEGSEDDINPLSFWVSFLEADLPSWDHRSHLKAGYVTALESAKTGDSVFTTADTFITHLRRLEETHPDRFRNTEHRTMTIFWLVRLQLAIWNYKIDKGLEPFPSWNDFQQVLLHSPSLRTQDSGAYTTPKTVFSAHTRGNLEQRQFLQPK